METFDTNILVRLLVEDDPTQSAQALAQWQRALAGGGAYLPKLVLAEAVWVLRTAYGFQRASIADAVDALLRTEGLMVEDRAQVRAAVTAYATSAADLSDHLTLETARQAQALPVRTFDQRFARLDGVSMLAEPAP